MVMLFVSAVEVCATTVSLYCPSTTANVCILVYMFAILCPILAWMTCMGWCVAYCMYWLEHEENTVTLV